MYEKMIHYHKKGDHNVDEHDSQDDKDCNESSNQSHSKVESQTHVLLPERKDYAVRVVGQTTQSGK